MKLRIEKNALLAELGLLQGTVEKKSTIPMLANILIEASGDSVAFTATDLDVSLHCNAPAEISEPGAVVFNAKRFLDVVRSLPEHDVVLESAGAAMFDEVEASDSVSVVSGSAKFKVVCHAKAHFPSCPVSPGDDIAFRADAFGVSIARTIFAITQEESRYALGGALFILKDESFQLVATDGHRLAMAAGKLECPVEDELSVLVPRKTLGQLQKLASLCGDEKIAFSLDDNHMFFDFAKRRLSSRKLAGQFPGYQQVIPKGNDRSVSIPVCAIAPAVQRAALMADGRTHGIRLDFETHCLRLTAQSADLGESVEEIPLDYGSAESAVLRFNAQYLLDFFSSLDSDNAVFEFKDGRTPVIMHPSNEAAEAHRVVVMPMRI